MPFIDIRVHPTISSIQAERLSGAVTEAMAEVLGKRPEVTAVCIQSAVGTTWTIGAQPPVAPTVYIDIKITAGTNSAAEKARLIAHLHGVFANVLGGLAEASYIVIHELPATDWGYAGRTQAGRMGAQQ